MKYQISDKLRTALKNPKYSHDVTDALCNEMRQYDGLDWTDYRDIANEVYSILLCDEIEVEYDSQVDEFMCAVLACAYDQAYLRISKALGLNPQEVSELDI